MANDEVEAMQDRIDAIVSELDGAIKGGLDALIPWIKKYADKADNNRINYRGDLVLQKLEDAGHKINQYTGPNFIKGNKQVMGFYIVGQVMGCLAGDGPYGKMPPAPVSMDFADQYMAMPDDGRSAPDPSALPAEVRDMISSLKRKPADTNTSRRPPPRP